MDKIEIRLTLEGEMAKRLETIRKKWGLENYADLLRMIISRYYEEIQKERPL